jgi:hypothetical protein
MRYLGFYLADVALRAAVAPSKPVAEPPDAAMAVTEQQVRAWRAWRIEGERDRAVTRVRRLDKVPVSRPHRVGPWLPLILGGGGLGG